MDSSFHPRGRGRGTAASSGCFSASRDTRGDELDPVAPPALLLDRALGLIDGREHLAHVPAEATFHDLLHDAPEVGGGLVLVAARPANAAASHQVPVDEAADVDRDVALALLELGGDLVERERPGLQVEEREDAALELVQDPRGGGGGPHAVDEDAGRTIHSVRSVQSV